jgi:hypothetical protein
MATANTIPPRARQVPAKESEVAKVRIARFLAALREDPVAAAELTDSTWKRWVSAQFPANVKWLLKAPHVLRALADDAEEWTADEWAEIEATMEKRAEAQAAYRRGESSGKRGRPKKNADEAKPKGRKK